MFKSVSEFAKLFSYLFLLCGIYFLVQQSFVVAIIGIVSFVIVKFLDSDWSFENLNFSNHNFVVGFATFFLVFLNVFFIYQEMRYDPLLNQSSAEVREEYLKFEKALFTDISSCAEKHNVLIDKLNSNETVDENEAKAARIECYKVIQTIEKEPVPEKLPQDVKKLCSDNRDEFKRIAVNITSFIYDKSVSQQSLISRIKANISFVVNTAKKTRATLKIKDDLSKEQKNFLKI